MKGYTDAKNIMRNWVARDKTFGTTNMSQSRVNTATAKKSFGCMASWAEYCRLGKKVTNAFARKTYSARCNAARHPDDRGVIAAGGASDAGHETQFRQADAQGLRYGTAFVPHLKWSRNPPSIRAAASRTLALYLQTIVDCRGKIKALPRTTRMVYGALP